MIAPLDPYLKKFLLASAKNSAATPAGLILAGRRFLANAIDARENGYDILCVECGVGLWDDGCDMHDDDCSKA